MVATNFEALLSSAAPERVALEFEGQSLTYGQLRAQVLQVAAGLQQAGIQTGDVVGVWLPNTPRWLVAHLACGVLGAATLSLNLKLGIKEVSDFVARARCKGLFFDAEIVGSKQVAEAGTGSVAAVLAHLQQASGGVLQCLVDASRTQSANHTDAWKGAGLQWQSLVQNTDGARALTLPDAQQVEQADCIIVSSSGTTSQPKLIAHTQGNVCRHIADVVRGFDVPEQGRVLLSLPMCGAFGYISALMTLAAGGTLVLQESFDPQATAQALAQQPITHFFGTNDMMEKVLDSVAPSWRPQALHFMGHANFVPGLDDLPAKAMAHGVRMVGCFGMSEIFALFAHQDVQADLPRRAQAGGIPISPGVQVRARLVESGLLAAPMEVGELEIKGPYMMRAYLGNPQATAQAFTEDGFLRTGDLGYVNGDGGFTHLSRLGDVLRIGGFLVNPAEIEEAVLSHCNASACQVVAVNSAGSSRPVAFVLNHPQLQVDEAHIKQQLLQQIAKYKVPIRIFVVDQFPYVVGPNGQKVKKNELRDLAQQMVNQEESV